MTGQTGLAVPSPKVVRDNTTQADLVLFLTTW